MWLYYIVPAVCPEACWYMNSSLVSLKTKSCQNYTISTALRKGKGRLTAHALLQVKVLCPFQESSGYLPSLFRSPSAFYTHGCADRRVLVVYLFCPQQSQLLWTDSCQILNLLCAGVNRSFGIQTLSVSDNCRADSMCYIQHSNQ